MCGVCSRPDCDTAQVDASECSGSNAAYQASQCEVSSAVLGACPGLCGVCVGANYPSVHSVGDSVQVGKVPSTEDGQTSNTKSGKKIKMAKAPKGTAAPKATIIQESNIQESAIQESSTLSVDSSFYVTDEMAIEVAGGTVLFWVLAVMIVLVAKARNKAADAEDEAVAQDLNLSTTSVGYVYIDVEDAVVSPVFLSSREKLLASPSVAALSRLEPSETASLLA